MPIFQSYVHNIYILHQSDSEGTNCVACLVLSLGTTRNAKNNVYIYVIAYYVHPRMMYKDTDKRFMFIAISPIKQEAKPNHQPMLMLWGSIEVVSKIFSLSSSSTEILLQPEPRGENNLLRPKPLPLKPVILDETIGITSTEDA